MVHSARHDDTIPLIKTTTASHYPPTNPPMPPPPLGIESSQAHGPLTSNSFPSASSRTTAYPGCGTSTTTPLCRKARPRHTPLSTTLTLMWGSSQVWRLPYSFLSSPPRSACYGWLPRRWSGSFPL